MSQPLFIFIIISAIAILFIPLTIIRTFLTVATVWGNSMYPTLEHGDRLLALRPWPSQWLRTGQIVIGRTSQGILGEKTPFVKRLIGLPGDHVMIHISELHEIMHPSLQGKIDANGNLSWYIPSGYCFVKGDALLSGDSVTWGPISLNSLTDLVLMKLPHQADLSQIEHPVHDYPLFPQTYLMQTKERE